MVPAFVNKVSCRTLTHELPEEENEINRTLYFLILDVIYERDPNGKYGAPISEAQNFPDPNTNNVQIHEKKIPDFQWQIIDSSQRDSRRRLSVFVTECKRLGMPKRSNWKFNENYVNNGIMRFINVTHKYGLHTTEGLMIGYIQSMDPADILTYINNLLDKNSVSNINQKGSFSENCKLSEYIQEVKRCFPSNEFILHHLWIDISEQKILN